MALPSFRTPFYGFQYGPKIPLRFRVFGTERGLKASLAQGPHRHRIYEGLPIPAAHYGPFRPEEIDWRTGTKENGWHRIKFPTCDLCTKRAVWEHPEGGLRCETCPRPPRCNPRGVSPDPDSEGRLSMGPKRAPSPLKELHDSLVAALKKTVKEAQEDTSMTLETRSLVLQRCSEAFSAIDQALSARIAARQPPPPRDHR
jgi:hypothetical protein